MGATVLVRDAISHDTIECLEQLLDAARAGHVVGIVFAAMLKRKRYMVNVAGEAHRDPTYARGVLGAIEDELRLMIQGKADADTIL